MKYYQWKTRLYLLVWVGNSIRKKQRFNSLVPYTMLTRICILRIKVQKGHNANHWYIIHMLHMRYSLHRLKTTFQFWLQKKQKISTHIYSNRDSSKVNHIFKNSFYNQKLIVFLGVPLKKSNRKSTRNLLSHDYANNCSLDKIRCAFSIFQDI